MVGRDPSRSREAVDDIIESTGNEKVEILLADFSSLDEVRGLAETVRSRCERLDVLINNAGVWHLERQLTAEGFEATFGVNHLAPFLLTNLLRESLVAASGVDGVGGARVVHVTSRLYSRPKALDFDDLHAERKYGGLRAYAKSKLANVLFSNELARRWAAAGVTSNSAHPGDVVTNITRDSRLLTALIPIGGKLWLKTPAQGAATSLHVATAPHLGAVTGRYFADSREKKMSRAAQDASAAKRLWEVSAELVGI
jgi:NAD(P)-dependent dehydrogenase (short-subunit alcohol dehydrogenase family)